MNDKNTHIGEEKEPINTPKLPQKSEAEIVDSAMDTIKILKKAYSDKRYESTGRKLSLNWLTADTFQAYAAVQPSDHQMHKIAISYKAAVLVYREAELFPMFCNTFLVGDAARELYDSIQSDVPPRDALPNMLTAPMIVERIAKSVVAWVYLHEQAHLFQQHGQISDLLQLPISEKRPLLIDEINNSNNMILSGQSACLRHLFELSADYEAMQYTIGSLIAAEDKTLRMETLWCFIAGLTCLFRRFFGYTTAPIRGAPSGTHPDPSYRMSMLLRGMSGFLCSDPLKKYVPWIQSEKDLFAVTQHATLTATIFIDKIHGDDAGGFSFLDRVYVKETMPSSYVKPMKDLWHNTRPIVVKNYFGLDSTGILPALPEDAFI